jgi:hypothetical protein
MVDQHPFLLEVLTQVNNNKFPFQQHFKGTCDLLPPLAHACFLPFEQFIGQQMVQFQDSILGRLHHHTLFNMFSNGTFEAHRVRILSCFGPGASAWLITQPILTNLLIILPNFLHNIFLHDLDYPILQLQASFNVCAHIPLTLWVSISYVVFMATNTFEPMMQFTTRLLPLHKMLVSIWDENNYMCFLQPHSTLLVNKLTLCLPNMTFTP